MIVMEWVVWTLAALLALMLLRVLIERGRIERHREAVLFAAVCFGLVVTVVPELGISKLHLLWFIPLVVIGTCLSQSADLEWRSRDPGRERRTGGRSGS